jgi:hypothetical protein
MSTLLKHDPLFRDRKALTDEKTLRDAGTIARTSVPPRGRIDNKHL